MYSTAEKVVKQLTWRLTGCMNSLVLLWQPDKLAFLLNIQDCGSFLSNAESLPFYPVNISFCLKQLIKKDERHWSSNLFFFKQLSEATFTMCLVIKYNLFSNISYIHFMHFKHLDYPSALPSVRKCGVSWILHILLYNVFMIMLI